MIRIVFLAAMLIQSNLCFASCSLERLIGYTLVAAKTVQSHIDKGIKKDDFEGCDYDRIIVFEDDTGVKCASYSYTYSYRPKAYIFVSNRDIKICVNDELFDASQIY
jgi:hypothetical protein